MRKIHNKTRRPRHYVLAAVVFTFSIFHFPFSLTADSAAFAAPTQDEVFKSIQNSENESVDGGKILAVLAAGVGLAIVLTLFSRRQKREAIPKPLNHQGKLLRELMKTAGLNSGEARQLKALADEMASNGEPLDSSITLLLCPSLLKKTGTK
jgi:hypothetical protein